MEIKPAEEASVSPGTYYVSWEEVILSREKGRRKVHYILKRKDGGSDLVVIGKEGIIGHMYYHYAIQIKYPSFSSPRIELKSRSDVVDWLNSNVRDSRSQSYGFLDCKQTNEIVWIGSPSTCERKRKHYPSFIRNGVKISVYDIVYVLAEENKRLVAYLKDIFEDSSGNKKAIVQWFHKTDEVGSVLPQNVNGREIFFSLSTQRLSIECIDGLATVLSPIHIEKCMNNPAYSQLELFVCKNQFKNDKVKPFDITQIKGYWNQKILRDKENLNRPKRPKKKELNPNLYLAVGSQIEVLCQDNGIRGCWFKAVIIKKRSDRVKVQYQNLKDAENEVDNVKEWIPSSKVAARDELEIWSGKRKTIRPAQQFNGGRVSCVVNVGAVVDAWWNDGWWEGLVIRKETDDQIHVYFPGEKKVEVFKREDIRHCQEWIESRWFPTKNRPELVPRIISSTLETTTDDHPSMKIDLLKDEALKQLKWRTSRKRKRGSCDHGILPSPKVELKNCCKYKNTSLFGPHCLTTSMVMSR